MKATSACPNLRVRLGVSVLIGCVCYSLLSAVQMHRIATLPHTLSQNVPCGDADHDLKIEAYGTVSPVSDSLVAFEHAGGNSFCRLAPGALVWSVWAFGDGDGDSLKEVVAQGRYRYCIFEAPDLFSMPSESVWSVPRIGSYYGLPRFTDLDRDGRQELCVKQSDYGIWLYENCGNNQYESAAVLTDYPPYGSYGDFDVGDFDRDGLLELVAGNPYRSLFYVFEATGGDNQYVLSAVCSTETFENKTHVAASDMDRDSWPEFVLMGRTSLTDFEGKIMVYEATGHAQYHRVWDCPVNVGFWWKNMSVGDVDGDKVPEFAVGKGGGVLLFKCTGPDRYEQVWSFDSARGYVRLFDINSDTRAELIFDVGIYCYIYEDTAGLGMAEFERLPKPSQVRAQPFLARVGQSVRLSGLSTGSLVQIHDPCGRLVRETAIPRPEDWLWDLRDARGQPVPAGSYIAVIRSPQQSASLKLCVIR